MSSHLSHKELNADLAAQGVEYVATHKSQATRVVVGIIVLALLVGAYMIYSNRQAIARADALSHARQILNSKIGPATPNQLGFPTEAEQKKAINESLTEVATKYGSSAEGSMARMYLASRAYDTGETDKAVELYRQVVSDGPSEFASSAKLSLAQILWGQEKRDESKKLLHELINRPTAFVSADQASLALARLQLKTEPEEARKLLEELTKSSTAISTTAVALSGQLPQK
jgi:predicted negative regulator of RcsB-dependent stress response